MTNCGLHVVAHSIPPCLPPASLSLLGLRLANASCETVLLDGHAHLFRDRVAEKIHRLGIYFDDQLVRNVELPDDCLRPGERHAVFFPLRTRKAGVSRLQVRLEPCSHAGAPRGDASLLLDLNVSVVAGRSLRHEVRRRLFRLRHSDLPILRLALQRRWLRTLFRVLKGSGAPLEQRALQRLKSVNRELACLEREVAKPRVASSPAYLSIDTSSRCNLSCRACARRHLGQTFDQRAEMPAAALERLIAELFPCAFTVNIATMGEPFLSSHVERILSACKQYGVLLSTTTNGTLLTGEILPKLCAVLRYIEISIDSCRPELFARLRGGASFRDVVSNALALGRIRDTLPEPRFDRGVSMTLFRENLEEVPDMLHLVREVRGNALKADIGVVFSRRETHRSVLRYPGLYNDVYRRAHDTARKLGVRLFMRAPFASEGGGDARHYGTCDYLYVSACIDGEGRLKPCISDVLGEGRGWGGFRAQWNGAGMRRLRAGRGVAGNSDACDDCRLVVHGSDTVRGRQRQFFAGEAADVGDAIHFGKGGNAGACQVSGWGEPEDGFAWTVGARAVLRLPVPALAGDFLSLTFDARGFVAPGKLARQRVRVQVNGRDACLWVFDAPGWHTRVLVVPEQWLAGTQRLEVGFFTPDAVSPAALGEGADMRALGVGIRSMHLTEWSAATPEARVPVTRERF